MKELRHQLGELLAVLGPRALPFADAASRELPLGRLLRLSLFQVSVGMALVLSLIHISEPTRLKTRSRMPSSA